MRTSRVLGTALALVLLLVTASRAHAQTGSHLSLGLAAGHHGFSDDRFHASNPSISAIYRISLHPDEARDGWRLKPTGIVGLSQTKADEEIAGRARRLGVMRSIPVMVGGGPSYRHGPTTVGLSVAAGYAFNHFTVDDDSRAAYRLTGQTLNSVEVGNAFAARPTLSVWQNLNSTLGLQGSVSYTYHRPKAMTNVNGVTTAERWKSDRMTVRGGLAFGIF